MKTFMETEQKFVEGCFAAVFNVNFKVTLESSDEENDTLNINNSLFIRITPDGDYILEKAVYIYNYPYSPDSLDFVVVGEVNEDLTTTVRCAIIEHVSLLFDIVLGKDVEY